MNKVLKVLGIIALLIFILIMGSCLACGKAIDEVGKEIDKKAAKTTDVKVGETKTVDDNLVVSFNKFNDNYKVEYPEKNKKYIECNITVKNVGKENVNLLGTFNAYANKKKVEQYYGLGVDNVDLSGELAPDTEMKGSVVFEVPKKSKDYKILFDYGVMDGKVNLITK